MGSGQAFEGFEQQSDNVCRPQSVFSAESLFSKADNDIFRKATASSSKYEMPGVLPPADDLLLVLSEANKSSKPMTMEHKLTNDEGVREARKIDNLNGAQNRADTTHGEKPQDANSKDAHKPQDSAHKDAQKPQDQHKDAHHDSHQKPNDAHQKVQHHDGKQHNHLRYELPGNARLEDFLEDSPKPAKSHDSHQKPAKAHKVEHHDGKQHDHLRRELPGNGRLEDWLE